MSSLLDWILKSLMSRAVVRPRNLIVLSGYFRAFLKERLSSSLGNHLPDSVVTSIVQEAYQRAAAKEKDGRARHGVFYKELEYAAEQVVRVSRGDQDADSRIKGILDFSNVT
jgi:hypothetical protein